MPTLDYAAARQALPLADVLTLLGWQPVTRRGAQARGPCPLHGASAGSGDPRRARSRSFAVHLGKNVYHCFRCGAGGNALDLWTAHTRLPLHAAVIDLCQRLGRVVPARREPDAPARPRGGPMPP